MRETADADRWSLAASSWATASAAPTARRATIQGTIDARSAQDVVPRRDGPALRPATGEAARVVGPDIGVETSVVATGIGIPSIAAWYRRSHRAPGSPVGVAPDTGGSGTGRPPRPATTLPAPRRARRLPWRRPPEPGSTRSPRWGAPAPADPARDGHRSMTRGGKRGRLRRPLRPKDIPGARRGHRGRPGHGGRRGTGAAVGLRGLDPLRHQQLHDHPGCEHGQTPSRRFRHHRHELRYRRIPSRPRAISTTPD